MAGISCLSIRISTKSAISIIRRTSIRNRKTVLKAFDIPLKNSRSTIFSCPRNNNNTAIALFNVHSRWFKTTNVLHEEIDVNIPEFPEAVSEGDIKWRKKVGDSVAIDEVVCEIETDKTSIEVPSPANGVITEIYVQEGGSVKSKQKVFRLKVGPAPAEAKDTTPKKVSVPEKAATPTAVAPPKPAAPPKPVAPPEPAKTPKPIDTPRPAAPPKPVAAPKSTVSAPIIQHPSKVDGIPSSSAFAIVRVPPKDPTKEIAGTRSEYRVKISKIRQKIGQRLKQAQNENAMLTTFNEIDMSNLIAFRKAHQEAFTKKYGIKLGFMSTFVKACAYALQDQPIINACIMDNEILYRDYVDISVAVATPKGLVVPVIRNASEMNFADIEKTINILGEKAKKGKLAIEDMDGGTFTISNGGVFGSLMGTPIINPPQSAILGMHATFERPIAIKGQIVIRPMMYVALTYDHRLIDGREAVLFLRKIKSGVENPVIIIAGM
ncbi:dihydrolipoyllysine-residue succinyltransferase component of 2-oxoglutarate dehydrogenase complex, mitochondrial [Halyomorpha halys]|uniref:dihydrolipoyllysine-residue succinyltransferase component of 2-oxoglutarate dehydrogenase complex, mitochondrial n=1 Tax=Halyomorpha halys TaxID=286706 RepID=UPI0006D4F194|nr:dihydrolipoyllysine-residue succinyltransferase component of 2-oxoglutarate dehydrogenase complex, mitochondrial-like [Halyomorpha halys]